MPVEGGSSGGGGGGGSGVSSALAARHPKQKRKAHSLSIRRTNSTEERQPLGILRGDMLEGQVSLADAVTRFSVANLIEQRELVNRSCYSYERQAVCLAIVQCKYSAPKVLRFLEFQFDTLFNFI